ncbi:M16 family metallopeptidase [Roseibacillus ishigakijimensis]|uniref:Insulinase family protein n=1 Tax=Roseibacillus ishigakijimensis TaxID=454146 RepID=A0A934RSE9_9BACT|nr:M16 family metallopeptidase [Roseibacillus ishigakijimensis]MBK1834791.1 insulinase family protein [Roseibacillus ishigakijimensis]
MKKFLPSLLAALVLGLCALAVFSKKDNPAATTESQAFATPPREPWPHETGDIPASERATFGSLPNGLRYVIIPNSEPPKRVALRMHIDAGSLHEEDDQRGVAHFLEHMVFNGSRNFPDPKDLIPQMERLGIAFGAHANAYTSFDETVYMLDLPNLAEPTLQLAFTVMRDFADGALLKEEEIDKERGVILSEKNSRDSVGMRLMEQQFEFLIPDSLITHRFPIGTEEVIETAERERFTSYYEDYYIPSKMTFIVVGDIEVPAMEERIRETFSSLRNPEQAGEEPALGTVPRDTGFRAAVFADKEVPSDDVSLLKIAEAEVKRDTVATRLEKQPLTIAHAILSRRFDILAKKEDSPIRSGSASRGVWFQTLEFGSLDVTAAEGRWPEAVTVLEQEYRRALEHGFTQDEFDEIKAKLLNAYEQAVEQDETRPSPAVAMEVVSSINDLRTFSSPQEDLRIARLGFAELTPADCLEAFRAFWDTPDLTLVLTTAEETATTQEELLAAYRDSQKKAVAPPEEREQVDFAYQDFGPAGTVLSEEKVEDLDLTQLVLSNQVRVNFKRTDFQKNSVSLLARFGTGKMSQPRHLPGLDQLAGILLNGGGLGAHSEDELDRILAGRNVSAGFGIGETALILQGRTTPEDLERQLQLMCAYLTDPGFRAEALRQYRKALPDLYNQLRHDLSGAQAQMSQWLHGDDPRYVLPELEQALSYTIADVQQWLRPQLENSYLELSIVGDFEPEELRAALLKTFAALPPRPETPETDPSALQIAFPATPAEKTFTYQSKIPKAAAMVLWETQGMGENVSLTRRLNILADILGNRMREKIREELGATYSPQASSNPSESYPDFGYLFGFSIAKPEDLETINSIKLSLGETLAKEGATADELARALNPVLSQLEQIERDNGYWLQTVLAQSQRDPFRLNWARERNDDYKSITLEEINKLAARYLLPERAVRVRLEPEPDSAE